MAAYLHGRPLADIDNLMLAMMSRRTAYTPYSWNRTTLEQLKGSGSLRQMRNAQLVASISAYEALTRHLDDDRIDDEAAGKAAALAASAVVNRNLPDFDALLDRFHDAGLKTPEEWDAFAAEHATGDNDKPLLVDDLREVHRMMNAYIALESISRYRHRYEIPRLQDMARELIQQLDAEYPE